MSGFEMHRFRTIDRDLTKEERREIDSWSSRFSPTSNGVTYIYHYGSFKKKTELVFAKYFDAMLYVDNWGTTQFMLRFPKHLVNWDELTNFTNIYGEKQLDFSRKGDYVIMDMRASEEESSRGWMEEEDFLLAPLLSLRKEILNGDYRTLYLGWLMVEEERQKYEEDDSDDDWDEDDDWDDDERIIPSIPANFKTLGTAHKELIQIFEINEKIVKAAGTVSPIGFQITPDYEQLITQLSDQEKNDFLLQLTKGEQLLEVRLRKRLDSLATNQRSIDKGKALDWNALKKLAK